MADKVVVVRLRAAVGEYTSGLARAGGQTVTFGGQLAGAANRQDAAMAKSKQAMATMGTAAAVAGKLMLAGVGGAMVVSAKAAIDFESSLAGVAKTVDGTVVQIDAIGESMRRLSLQIPVNVNELNRIAELGGQLGVSIPGLLNFTKTIAALGVTTNLSTEDAAKGLARLINVTGEGEDSFDNLGSIIVDLGNNFATTESEILTFALRIAPAAQTVGATAGEVLGLASALSSMGVPAERGGTAVQTMFTIMASAARAGGDDLSAMSIIVGQTSDEFGTMILNSPTDAMVELATGLGRANDRGEDVFAMMRNIGIAGRRAQSVLLAMSNNTDLVTDSLDRASIAGDENVALFEEAARRYGTTASEISIMANAFTDLRIEIGQGMLPFIRDTVQTMAAFFTLMRENSGTVKGLGKLLLGLGFGILVLGLIKSVLAFRAFWIEARLAMVAASGFSRAAATMSFAMGPIGIALGVISIAVIAFGIASVNAARDLAALKQSADEYASAVEQGIDPTQALIDTLDTDEILAAAEGFDLVGESIQGASDAAQNPQDLEDFIQLLIEAREEIERKIATTGVFAALEGEAVQLFIDKAAIDRAIETAERFGEVIDREVTERAVDMALAVKGAGVAGSLSMAQLQLSAEEFARAFPKATGEDFVNRFRFNLPRTDELTFYTDQVKKGLGEAGKSWEEYLGVTEEGVKRQETFDKEIADLAEDFAKEVTESFDDVRETVLEGFPAWDEYGDSATVAIDKVIEAQQRMLEDVQRWAPAQASLIGTVSGATLNWIDSLDPVTKGALGRLFANDPLKFAKFVADVEANLLELSRAADEQLISRLPQIVGIASTSIGPNIAALVAALELPPGDAEALVGAYEDGLESFFAALPASLGPKVIAAIRAALDPTGPEAKEAIRSQGERAGALFIDGINLALLNANLESVVVETITKPVVDTIESDFGISSPSKVAIRLGESFTEGLTIGMSGGLDAGMFQRVVPAFSTMLDQISRQGLPARRNLPSPDSPAGSSISFGDIRVESTASPTDLADAIAWRLKTVGI